MFPTRMGSEKPGSEALQDAFLKKRKKDLIGTKKAGSASEICIAPMIIAHLSFLQKEKGTLPTFRCGWMQDMLQLLKCCQ